MFNEREKEYSAKQKCEVDVWQSPKYKQARAKAVELIEGQKYGLTEGDFWILMNETKSGKMGYTGLIISHNGCLKINDGLSSKFNPECVTVDKEGFSNSLVCFYCNPAQGLFEVGEVSSENCKNPYPYAMAVKRLFDRVVLKLSKLAYDGIYGEDEADTFKQDEEPKAEKQDAPKPKEKTKDDLIGIVEKMAGEKHVPLDVILSQYEVKALKNMTKATLEQVIRRLEVTK